jgi:hypothetical protein
MDCNKDDDAGDGNDDNGINFPAIFIIGLSWPPSTRKRTSEHGKGSNTSSASEFL